MVHIAAKNYTRNYSYTTGIHQNRRITYERALRNLTVLMFSHFVHQLENSGSLEGHQTLIVHECLQVAAALSRYHRWQCRVNLQEISSENADWNKISKVGKDDFRHKYSPALTLLGTLKTWRLPTRISLDVVMTMSTSMEDSLAIYWQEGSHRVKSSQ